MASLKITVTSDVKRMVPIGRGWVELVPGWSGRVKQEVFDYAHERGWVVQSGDIDAEPFDSDDLQIPEPPTEEVQAVYIDDQEVDFAEPPEFDGEEDNGSGSA